MFGNWTFGTLVFTVLVFTVTLKVAIRPVLTIYMHSVNWSGKAASDFSCIVNTGFLSRVSSAVGSGHALLDLDQSFCHLGFTDFLCGLFPVVGRNHLVSWRKINMIPTFDIHAFTLNTLKNRRRHHKCEISWILWEIILVVLLVFFFIFSIIVNAKRNQPNSLPNNSYYDHAKRRGNAVFWE